MDYLVCLIPILVAFILVTTTKRPFESVIAGLVSAVMIYGIKAGDYNFVGLFVQFIMEESAKPDTVWVIVFTLLIGAFVEIIDASKGTAAVSGFVSKYANSEKKTLLSVLAMGIAVFPDEFLKGVVLCSYGKDIGKKNRISMESMGLCIVALCIPLCILMPYTTWSAYFAKMLQTFAISGDSFSADYITKVIPFLFFPIAFMVIIVLYMMGIIPKFGAARGADKQIKAGNYDFEATYGKVSSDVEIKVAEGRRRATILDFFIPIIVLLIFALYYAGDLVVALCVTIVLMAIWYLVRHVMNFSEFMDAFFRGMNIMLKPTIYLVLGFCMTSLVGEIGFPELVQAVTSWMAPAVFLPFAFLASALFGMVTGMMWPTTRLFLTACLPIAAGIGVSPFILAAALFSGAGLSSVLSPRGALIMLISQELNSNVVYQMKTIRPYTLMAGLIAAIGFLIVGFLI